MSNPHVLITNASIDMLGTTDKIEAGLNWIRLTPDIPRRKKYVGIIYEAPCSCGGTIKAVRNTLDSYHAKCSKCNNEVTI